MQDEQPTTPDPVPLQPALQDAERLLRDSLGQVCATDPARADTGEMIRLDEMLAIAGEAAKRAVSIRRRLRQEGRAAPRALRAPRRRPGATDSGLGPAVATPTAQLADAPPREAPAADAPDPVAPTLATRPAADAAPATAPATAPSAAPASTTTAEGAGASDVASEHRTFRDSRGVVWSVWAVHPMATRGRRAGLRGSYLNGWLAFVCEAEKRRLTPVPDGWTAMDDAALEALCGSAELARPEAPTRRMKPITDD